MSELDDKLGAILSNPDLMRQIAAMSQALSQSQGQSPPPAQPQAASPPPPPPSKPPQQPPPAQSGMPDLGAIARIAGIAGKTNIDSQQRALLKALGPYLSKDRIQRLERAMRAAKLAQVAGSIFGPGGQNPGR